MKRALVVVSTALTLQVGLGCTSPKSDRAIESAAASHPRVVCLTPSATETVAAVAGVDIIVGVDEFSEHPKAVTSLPRVGGFVDPSLEAILRLRPTLVVMDQVQSNVAASLGDAGIDTLILQMKTVSDLKKAIRSVGSKLGRAQAARAVLAELDRQLANAATLALEARGTAPAPRVLFVVDRQLGTLGNIVASGPGSYVDEVIQLAGGSNVLGDAPSQFLQISVEEVLRRKPDVILDAVHVEDPGARKRTANDWRVLSGVPAIEQDRVYVLGNTAYVHPSPRLGETVNAIARLLWAPVPATAPTPPAARE